MDMDKLFALFQTIFYWEIIVAAIVCALLYVAVATYFDWRTKRTVQKKEDIKKGGS